MIEIEVFLEERFFRLSRVLFEGYCLKGALCIRW